MNKDEVTMMMMKQQRPHLTEKKLNCVTVGVNFHTFAESPCKGFLQRSPIPPKQGHIKPLQIGN